MATAYTFYTTLMNNLDTTVLGFISTSTASVVSSISNAAYSMVTLYVILWGWATLRGTVSEPIGDSIARLVKIMIILAASLNLTYYSGWIVNFLYHTPDALASAMTGSPASASSSFLDTFMGQMFDLAEAYKAKAEELGDFVPDLTLMAMSWAITLVGLLLTIFGAFLTMLSKMGLGILLGFGAIPIFCTLFEGTKKFFDAWIGQVLNLVFLIVLVGAGLQLIQTIIGTWITTNAAALSADPSFIDALPPIAYSVIGFLVLMQLPSIASALGGGASMSTLGAMNWAAGKLASGGRYAKNEATGKNSYDRQRARRQAEIGRNVRSKRLGALGSAISTGIQDGIPSALYKRMTTRKNRVSNPSASPSRKKA